MLQRAFYLAAFPARLDRLLRLDERRVYRAARVEADRRPGRRTARRPCSGRRELCKRLAQLQPSSNSRELYEKRTRRPYPWLAVPCAAQFAARAITALGIAAARILFDAPPAKREVEFHVEVYLPKAERLSPARRGLARGPHAGPRAVRRLRQDACAVFAARIAGRLESATKLTALLLEAIDAADSEHGGN